MTANDLIIYQCINMGHFENEDGTHTDTEINCAKLLQTADGIQLVKNELKRVVNEEWYESNCELPDVIIGGVIFSSLVACTKNKFRSVPIRAMYCERKPEIDKEKLIYWDYSIDAEIPDKIIKQGKLQFHKGFEIKKGEKVLIATDVVKTGKEIGEIAELIREQGGKILGVISIIDGRKDKKNSLEWYDEGKYEGENGVCSIKPFISLIQLNINTWDKEDCPLCIENCKTCINYSNMYKQSDGLVCNNCKEYNNLKKKTNWKPEHSLVKL